MDKPVPLIALADLSDGRGRRLCKAGHDLALFRFGDVVHAIDDSCPHAGASLSGGRVEGRRVVCRAHGLKFDLEAGCPGADAVFEPRRHRVRIVEGIVMLLPES